MAQSLQVTITDELKDALVGVSEAKGATISNVMRHCITQWGYDRYMDAKAKADAVESGTIYSEDPNMKKQLQQMFNVDLKVFKPFADLWLEIYPQAAPGDIVAADDPKPKAKKGGK